MNKWQVQPAHWNYLPQRQQQRMFKTGIRIAGRLIIALTLFSLVIEAKLGL